VTGSDGGEQRSGPTWSACTLNLSAEEAALLHAILSGNGVAKTPREDIETAESIRIKISRAAAEHGHTTPQDGDAS
jgi:hypothetical protein